MYVTPLFAGILALVFYTLALRVILARGRFSVGLGDGGERLMLRYIRVHGNFAEYVPLVLILMMMGELLEAPFWLTTIIGAVLVAGRMLHAVGVSREPEISGSRQIGMGLTFTALLLAAGVNLWLGVAQFL